MRRILIRQCPAQAHSKTRGQRQRLNLEAWTLLPFPHSTDVLAIDEALTRLQPGPVKAKTRNPALFRGDCPCKKRANNDLGSHGHTADARASRTGLYCELKRWRIALDIREREIFWCV